MYVILKLSKEDMKYKGGNRILLELTAIDKVNPQVFRTCELSVLYPEKFSSMKKGSGNGEYAFFLEQLTKNQLFKVISEEEIVDIRYLRLCKNELVVSLVYEFAPEEMYFRVDAGDVEKVRSIVEKVLTDYIDN